MAATPERSICWMRFFGGFYGATALFNARIARSRFMRLLTAQPIIRRECRSGRQPDRATLLRSTHGLYLQPISGSVCVEVPVQQIGRDVDGMFAVGRDLVLL